MFLNNILTKTADTKRNADLGSGRTGDPATHLTGVKITPLYPLNSNSKFPITQDTSEAFGLASPREAKEAFHVPEPGASLPDVIEGDILVIDGHEYPIAYVGEWENTRVPSLHIVVGEVKNSG